MPNEPTITDLDPRHASAGRDLNFDVQKRYIGTRYELGEEIARGGIGRVFSAYDHGLKREIAIKVLQDRFQEDPQARRRFLNEAKIVAKLQHPGIAPIYELLRMEYNQYFITMPLIRGTTLEKLLSSRQAVDQ